jgi:hypothetical protein
VRTEAHVAAGDHAQLFKTYCVVEGLTPGELASHLIAEALDRLAREPDIAVALRDLRRRQVGLRVIDPA